MHYTSVEQDFNNTSRMAESEYLDLLTQHYQQVLQGLQLNKNSTLRFPSREHWRRQLKKADKSMMARTTTNIERLVTQRRTRNDKERLVLDLDTVVYETLEIGTLGHYNNDAVRPIKQFYPLLKNQ
jgi:hypothetical protein